MSIFFMYTLMFIITTAKQYKRKTILLTSCKTFRLLTQVFSTYNKIILLLWLLRLPRPLTQKHK